MRLGVCVRVADAALVICFIIFSFATLSEPYRQLHDDALFYFQVAHCLASGEGLVFGADIPTNGFHPFWLLICGALARLASDRDHFVVLMAAATILLNAGTILMVRIALARSIRPIALSVGLLIALPYFLFAGYGMETALASFFVVGSFVCAVRFLETSMTIWLVLSAWNAGLAVFARLDLAIALVPLAIYALAFIVRKRSEIPGLALVLGAAVGVMPVLAWLTFNMATFGDPVPISGRLKLSSGDADLLVATTGMVKTHFATVVAGVTILLFLNRGTVANIVILMAGSGQVLYISYLYVSGQAEIYAWYFVVLAIVSGLVIAATLDTLADRASMVRLRSIANLPLRFAAISAIALMGLAATYQTAHYAGREGFEIDEYRQSTTSLGAVAEREGIRRVLAFDRPGQLAYLDGLDVIALDGLTTNLMFQERLRERGVAWLIETYAIDAFVGPRESPAWIPALCDGTKYLGAMRFVCKEDGSFDRVELFSRLDGTAIGAIELLEAQRVDFEPNRNLALYVFSPRRAPTRAPRATCHNTPIRT